MRFDHSKNSILRYRAQLSSGYRFRSREFRAFQKLFGQLLGPNSTSFPGIIFTVICFLLPTFLSASGLAAKQAPSRELVALQKSRLHDLYEKASLENIDPDFRKEVNQIRAISLGASSSSRKAGTDFEQKILHLQLTKIEPLEARTDICAAGYYYAEKRCKEAYFLQQCPEAIKTSSPTEGQRTIKILFEFLQPSPRDCKTLAAKLLAAKSLELNNLDIVSLEPFSYLKHLQELHAPFNRVENLEPLKGLPELENLNLTLNQVSNIEPLLKLKKLRSLGLFENKITQLDIFPQLTTLDALYLEFNPITDFQPLSRMKNLTKLSLQGTGIGNLEPLSGLTQLQSLNLLDNKISKLDALRGLKSLNVLRLDNNQITSLEPLQNLSGMQYLGLAENPIVRDAKACPEESANLKLNEFCRSYLKSESK